MSTKLLKQTHSDLEAFRAPRAVPPPYRFSVTPAMENSAPPAGSVARDVLFAEFRPLTHRLIGQYGGDPELRQDLSGEIYLRFCALLDAFDPARGVPLRAYLVRQLTTSIFTYARHHWQQRRRETHWDSMIDDLRIGNLVDPTRQWVDRILLDQIGDLLPTALAQLTERQSQILIWRYYEGRSYEDIAEQLGIQSATVRSLLRHAINNLRRWFAQSSFHEDGNVELSFITSQ